MAADPSLPDASSPDLILALPTLDEMKKIWSNHFHHWGRNLTHEGYMGREEHMLNAPVNQNGVFTVWILTTAAAKADGGDSERPILASCETYRKKAIMRGAHDSAVRDVCGYGIGSVYTFTEFRGRGYASRMMALLRDQFAKLHRESGAVPCSILYSDIGREFYSKSGWITRETTSYLEFPVREEESAAAVTANGSDHSSATPILDQDVPAFAAIDEALLRRQLSTTSSNPEDQKKKKKKKTQLAFLPNAETHSWHFQRDDFYCNLAFSRTPAVRGAVYTPHPASQHTQSRVWAIWTAVHYGGLDNIQNNILCINRLVIEDETISDDELARAVRAILRVAATEAREWRLAKVHLWNPSERIRACCANKLPALSCKYVVRERDSLASLNWFGEEAAEDIEWVANERYTWC